MKKYIRLFTCTIMTILLVACGSKGTDGHINVQEDVLLYNDDKAESIKVEKGFYIEEEAANIENNKLFTMKCSLDDRKEGRNGEWFRDHLKVKNIKIGTNVLEVVDVFGLKNNPATVEYLDGSYVESKESYKGKFKDGNVCFYSIYIYIGEDGTIVQKKKEAEYEYRFMINGNMGFSDLVEPNQVYWIRVTHF